MQYDPAPSGSESAFEWVELHNPGGEAVSLTGWVLADNRAEDVLPESSVPAGGYLVVAGGRFGELFPSYDGPLVTLGSIGNGLGNGGDRLRLIDAEGREVDAMSYGDDAGALDPPVPTAPAGHSLEREPAGHDSDTAADWVAREVPTPGAAGTGAEAPPARTTAPTVAPATASPGPTSPPVPEGTLWVNEILAAPAEIDWDGDGEANRADEWIELYNAGDEPIDLRGWQVDDVADAGSSPFLFEESVVLPARGHLLLFQRDTGLALNNGGDAVRLLHPDGREADVFTYPRTSPDASWARATDGAAAWVDDLPPSPGAPNGAAGPTATPETPPDPEGTATSTPPAPGPGPVPTAVTPGVPSPEASPAPLWLPFLLSEVLYDSLAEGNDAAWEWVEIHNRSDREASLAGWSIGDRQAWDALGEGVVPARGFVVVAASEAQARVLGRDAGAGSGPDIIVLADGRIGAGLGNDGDVLRLRGPTGIVADQVGWGDADEAFDPHPAAPLGPPGVSLERIPPDRDRDRAEDWWLQVEPSPGRAGELPWHLDAPPLTINEVLPAPRYVDWNGDGAADHTDEWVELHNAAAIPVDLKGWRLTVGEPARWSVGLPVEGGPEVARPGGFVLLHRAATGLHLANEGDTLRLLRPDGVEADRLTWTASPGADRSWGRRGEGDPSAGWSDGLAVTPGAANRPLGAGERHRAEEAREAAKAARDARWADRGARREGGGSPIIAIGLDALHSWGSRTRVVVRGWVTAPPGTFGAREMYIGDARGGVRLYLARAEHRFPEVRLGDPVAAIGRLSDYRGERQVRIHDPADVWWDGEGPPAAPAELPTGAIGEATEGRLVRLAGYAVDFGGPRITIDDGSGPARVVWRASSELRRPWLPRGAWLEVTGIAGQSDARAPWTSGYRVVPRFAEDVAVGRSAAPHPAAGSGSKSVPDEASPEGRAGEGDVPRRRRSRACSQGWSHPHRVPRCA